MSSDDWDLIRFETHTDGPTPLGRNVKLVRNGEEVRGVKSLSLNADTTGAILLTTTQYVRLEGSVTLEEATQALEEREALWKEHGSAE